LSLLPWEEILLVLFTEVSGDELLAYDQIDGVARAGGAGGQTHFAA